MTNTSPAPATPVNTGIDPADLATFRTTPDGNLKVKLERFGCLAIELPNSDAVIEVYVTRSNEGDRPFHAYIATEQKIDGKTHRVTRVLTRVAGSDLVVLPNAPATKKDRQQSTGRAAAASDAAESVAATTEEETSHAQETPVTEQPTENAAANEHPAE